MEGLPLLMGCPWEERTNLIFSQFHAKITYTYSLFVLQQYFSRKMTFFEKSWIPLYRRGRFPRFRSKSEMYTYYSTKMLCVKFQRSRATRMWPFDDLNSFFFAHFLASETQWGTPLISAHLVATHVWACVRSNDVRRSWKYQPHEALCEISIFIGKSGFSGPAPT